MKTFTLEDANALIPQLEALLSETRQLRDSLVLKGVAIQPTLAHAGGNGGSKVGSEYVMTMQRFNACLAIFQDLGCELKDIDQGLIDFPSYRGEQLVYLCWKSGEKRIEFWHTIESGFLGRQPL